MNSEDTALLRPTQMNSNPNLLHKNMKIVVFSKINIIDGNKEFQNKFKQFSHSLIFLTIYGYFY